MMPAPRRLAFVPGVVALALVAAAGPEAAPRPPEPGSPDAIRAAADGPQDAPPVARAAPAAPARALATPDAHGRPPGSPPGSLCDDAIDQVVTPDAAFRATWGLEPWHARMVRVGGLPILGSTRLPDAALREAAWVVRSMTRARPELLAPIAEARVRLVVMNHDEFTSDVPEHRDVGPPAFWDRRARGLGATRARPALSCGVENLLGYDGDPYAGESILVHELAHAVHEFALAALDPTFDRRLAAAYDAAMVEDLWRGTYASTNAHEYFAEGVQAYFDTNRAEDREHNDVDTREELHVHDPRLFALIDEAFAGNPWRYRPPSARPRAVHLRAGREADDATPPRFEWPDRVIAAFEAHRARTRRTYVPLEVHEIGGGAAPTPSRSGGEKTRIRFVNRTGGSLRLAWIDTLGAPRTYGWVRTRGHHDQPTFAGHVWLLMDGTGRPVAWTVAGDRRGRAVIGEADDEGEAGAADPDGLMPPSRR